MHDIGFNEEMKMNEECLICKAPLAYLNQDEEMECALCHKKQYSKTKCVHGHFVCDVCHTGEQSMSQTEVSFLQMKYRSKVENSLFLVFSCR